MKPGKDFAHGGGKNIRMTMWIASSIHRAIAVAEKRTCGNARWKRWHGWNRNTVKCSSSGPSTVTPIMIRSAQTTQCRSRSHERQFEVPYSTRRYDDVQVGYRSVQHSGYGRARWR